MEDYIIEHINSAKPYQLECTADQLKRFKGEATTNTCSHLMGDLLRMIQNEQEERRLNGI